MSPNPSSFITHLRDNGYHSRSNKHSNAFCEAVVQDIILSCPYMEERASVGELVYDLNFTLIVGTTDWNVDLVFGSPPPSAQMSSEIEGIKKAKPSTIHVAIEIKSVMTEHRKAVKNRKRDFEAHHEHVHNYNRRAIAGACLIINGSSYFQSPLRKSPTVHKEPRKLIEHCLAEFRGVSVRSSETGVGLDAGAAIVVDMDNIKLNTTKYIEKAPAPEIGDPIHYDAFIQKICTEYRRRF